ncbi:hypothetical protein [Microlunatus speluncae]|uniref:hypothetical protein n=1 Tax=Microlunatus speluncae TaxID=2594267 RepID=UPI0012666DB9|nr:hypothetical protein [Microlunatus speluncae]
MTIAAEDEVLESLRRRGQEIIDAELGRLRRAAPTLTEPIVIEVDRTLQRLLDGWLLTPVRLHPDRLRDVSVLFGLMPQQPGEDRLSRVA